VTARRAWVLVSIALVLSCNKQQAPDSASPSTSEAEDLGAIGAKDARDPAAQLAELEAELAVRKAELAARGVELGASTKSATTPPLANRDEDELLRSEPQRATTKRFAVPDQTSTKKAKKAKKPKKAKRKLVREDASAPADAEPDACAPICGPAQAICELRESICRLADEHDDETRYEEACERATDDCDRAAEACEDCRE
jgi:hypothetical protein